MQLRRFASLAPILALAGCGDDAGLPDARPPADAAPVGQISVSWMLTHGGGPQTCASVGASSVTVEIVVAGEPFGVIDSFSCTTGSGTTRDLAPDVYDLKISVAGFGTLDGPDEFRGVEVKSNMVTAVGPVGFDVEPTGSLMFRINTPPTGGNCATAASMGAGISATTLELRDAGNTCVPTTFTIAAGASDPAGTYVSDCAGSTYACIAADQDIRADGVLSGQHSMIMTGLVGAAPCWRRTSQFNVRAANQITALNPQTLMLDTLVPGCPSM